MKLGLSLATGVMLSTAASTALAAGPVPAPPILAVDRTAAPADRCAMLRSPAATEAFARIAGAPTSLTTVRILPAGGTHGKADDDLPEICRVEGTIAPTTGFLLRMPTKNWNGKFMMGGCGGPCGNYLEDRIDHALVRNYAVVTTDMGHKGGGWLFAYNNPQGQMDFAYRATHLTAVVAKQLIAAFYGTAAARNYFVGCSTGGRQAMIEAQRFPDDFNGIVAGAPVYDEIGDAPYFLEWNTRVNTAPDGSTILTQPAAELIHKAVLAQCDAKDGLKDGLLMNPAACPFDPKALVCKPGAAAGQCLTPDQARVAQQFHDGARNSKGDKLYWGMPWGSEDQWTNYFGWISPTGKQSNAAGTAITGYLGYGISPPGGPGYRITDFDYDRDPATLALAGTLYNPTNPDLSKFRAAGGKLILFHGWNDNNIPVEASIDYYESATRANGGKAGIDKVMRFFTPPGINHCRGGEGGGEIDWITALENWVEKGQAPEMVTAYHPSAPYPMQDRTLEDYGAPYSKFGRHPLAVGSYDRARPVYAYPAIAKYSGSGDPADPRNWRKAAP